MTTTDPVRFEVQSPSGSTVTLPSSEFFAPGDATESVDIPSADDVVVVDPPDATGSTVDEVQYKLVLALASDYDPSTCSTQMSADETWTVTIQPQTGTDPQATSACPVSFRQRGGVTSCELVPPVLSDGPKASIESEVIGCQGSRPPVSAVLVLDKSGSMTSAASPSTSESRIEALRGSVDAFVTTWDSIRSVEAATTPFADPPRDDDLGMVFFTGDAERMSDVGVGAWSARTDVLYDFTDLRPDVTPSNLNGVSPGGITSLGDGLIDAVGALGTGASPDRRKVVLAMTDGMQNESEYVATDLPASVVNTHPEGDPTNTTQLVGPGDDIQIYTVTTGPSSTVGADLNEAIAQATDGFYTNAEIDAGGMRIFFTELLQNFVKFTSYETIHQAAPQFSARGGSYTQSFPVTMTSTSLVATLSAARDVGYFRLRLTGPDGTTYESEGSRTVMVSVPLATMDPGRVAGEWTATLDLIDPAGDGGTAYLSVIADDVGTRTAFRTDAADTEPGLTFRVTATPTGPSGPVDDADVRVTVGAPDAGIGDVLAQAQVKPSPPDTQDVYSQADAKLYRLLQENPEAFPRSSNTIQLQDNGRNGDETAGDGVYSATVDVGEPGHYRLQYLVRGETEETGAFRREQIHTVHARAVPNSGTTEVQAQVANNALQLTIIPRTFTGGRLGVGYANYLWLTTGAQGQQVRVQDQLNGSYRANIPFTGQRPQVNLHFLRLNTVLSGDFEQSPVPLGEDSQLIAGIEDGKERGKPVPPDADPDGEVDDEPFCNFNGGSQGLLVFGVVILGGVLVLRRRRA